MSQDINTETQEDTVEIEIITSAQVYRGEKAEIDVQVATARAYPRDTKRSIEDMVICATMSPEMAKKCGYALPRAGKVISGPSVHLARIAAQNWGNLRAGTKTTDIEDKYVVSEAVCWDLQKNLAIKVTARKTIIDKDGRRYNDNLIALTTMAANSVALRNAIFAVIPNEVIEHVYQKTRQMIVGELDEETVFVSKRLDLIKRMITGLGVTEADILNCIGRPSVTAVTREDMSILIGLAQAISDNEATVADFFKKGFDRESRPKFIVIAQKKQAERLKKKLKGSGMDGLVACKVEYEKKENQEHYVEVIDELIRELINQENQTEDGTN